MKFSTLEQIQNHAWVGNHASDRAAFDAVHDFVMDTNRPVADRAAALRVKYDKGMGVDPEIQIPDEELVSNYLSAQN